MVSAILKNLLLRSVYPVALFAAGWIVLRSLSLGPAFYVQSLTIVFASAVGIALLERFFPYHLDWNSSHGDLRTDTLHTFINIGSNQLGILLLVFLGERGVTGLSLWPRAWPFWTQIILAFLIADFGFYWVHRTSHRWECLWRFHAVHHSATRIYWLNGERRHPVNHWLEILFGPGMVALMGAGIEVIAVHGTIYVVHLMFQHSNSDYRAGPLRYVFAVAEIHRFHHLKDRRQAMVNFGGLLIIWDLLFGTFRENTERISHDSVGIADMPAYPSNYLGQLVQPFRPNSSDLE